MVFEIFKKKRKNKNEKSKIVHYNFSKNCKAQIWVENPRNAKNISPRFFGRPKQRRAQIWVETVIYLLIAFVMIGLVLSFVKPRIEELKDKAIIEQSVKMLNDLDNLILTIGAPGNKRLLEAGIKKGTLTIDGKNDVLIFEINSAYLYSEPGETIQIGNILVKTQTQTRYNKVTLTSNYSGSYNITYKGEDEQKDFNVASIPYKLIVSNEGVDLNQNTIINIDLS